ncbi:MAG: ParA family protein [Ignavibacteriae bacterium]|nr:ParA family protein [Ignavibacteriota bacterium]
MKIISAINFKGGVGKTTITWLLAKFLAVKNQKNVLVVDIDSQMCLTLAVHFDEEKGRFKKDFESWYLQHIKNKKTFLDALESFEKGKGNFLDYPISASMIYKMSEKLHFIPSTDDMYWLESDISNRDRVKSFVKVFLNKLEHTTNFDYDYVFFDCPAYFNALTHSVLSNSDLIIIPVNPDVFASTDINEMLEGLSRRIQPLPPAKIGVVMNKAKTMRDVYLTPESKKFLKDAKQAKTSIEHRGISIEVFDSCIPEKGDIKKAMPTEKFPQEFEECFSSLWSKLKGLVE